MAAIKKIKPWRIEQEDLHREIRRLKAMVKRKEKEIAKLNNEAINIRKFYSQ